MIQKERTNEVKSLTFASSINIKIVFIYTSLVNGKNSLILLSLSKSSAIVEYKDKSLFNVCEVISFILVFFLI